MKKSLLKKQTTKNLKAEYAIVNIIFIALASVIFTYFAISIYQILVADVSSINLLPIALLPILIVLGLKRFQIKKALGSEKKSNILAPSR